jgi:hypothetical protein
VRPSGAAEFASESEPVGVFVLGLVSEVNLYGILLECMCKHSVTELIRKIFTLFYSD